MSRKMLTGSFVALQGTGGEAFGKYIRAEMAKYEKIIKDAKIKLE